MQKDFGLFRYLVLAFMFVIGSIGYRGYATYISNWRGLPPVDYATNKNCSNHYSQGNAGWYRSDNWNEPLVHLLNGDTLMVGLDYYALMGVCQWIVPDDVLYPISNELANGCVYIFKVWVRDENFWWIPIERSG